MRHRSTDCGIIVKPPFLQHNIAYHLCIVNLDCARIVLAGSVAIITYQHGEAQDLLLSGFLSPHFLWAPISSLAENIRAMNFYSTIFFLFLRLTVHVIANGIECWAIGISFPLFASRLG